MAVVAATQPAGHDGAEMSAARARPASGARGGRHLSACGDDTIKALLTKS
jgi:hypothetical protein